VSGLPLPGNDTFVMDDLVMFNVHGGNDEQVEIQLDRDPDLVEFCRNAFESAWDLATPHREYKPAARRARRWPTCGRRTRRSERFPGRLRDRAHVDGMAAEEIEAPWTRLQEI
jgi:hypothetical protein